MASTKRLLIENIMNEIRRMLSEQNVDGNVSDSLLLDALNRAQEEAAMILARNYPEPLLTKVNVTTTASEPEYDIPEDAFEERVQFVELILSGSSPRQLEARETMDNSLFESSSGTATYPEAWCHVGFDRKIRVLPQPMAGLTLRLWYCKELPQLVVSQGMITAVDETDTILTLDEVGDDITTSLDEDGSHLSVIDGQTGAVKGIFEVSDIERLATGEVEFKTSTPQRPTIDNVTVSTSFVGLNIAVGDYVCVAPCTCICQIRHPFVNHMKQYAFAFLQYMNGGDIQVPQAALARMIKDVEKMGKGRPSKLKVKQSSFAYRRPYAYYRPTSSS